MAYSPVPVAMMNQEYTLNPYENVPVRTPPPPLDRMPPPPPPPASPLSLYTNSEQTSGETSDVRYHPTTRIYQGKLRMPRPPPEASGSGLIPWTRIKWRLQKARVRTCILERTETGRVLFKCIKDDYRITHCVDLATVETVKPCSESDNQFYISTCLNDFVFEARSTSERDQWVETLQQNAPFPLSTSFYMLIDPEQEGKGDGDTLTSEMNLLPSPRHVSKMLVRRAATASKRSRRDSIEKRTRPIDIKAKCSRGLQPSGSFGASGSMARTASTSLESSCRISPAVPTTSPIIASKESAGNMFIYPATPKKDMSPTPPEVPQRRPQSETPSSQQGNPPAASKVTYIELSTTFSQSQQEIDAPPPAVHAGSAPTPRPFSVVETRRERIDYATIDGTRTNALLQTQAEHSQIRLLHNRSRHRTLPPAIALSA